MITQLVDLRRHAAEYAMRDGRIAEDDYFYAEQNARLVRDAEQYYRTMYRGEVSSWNLRDRHMAETLDALVDFFNRNGPARKWSSGHTTRTSAMPGRRRWGCAASGTSASSYASSYGREAVLVGCTTYDGTVTAASNWDAPAERKRVRPALPGSYEALFHDAGLERFLLILARPPRARPGRAAARAGHRRDLPARAPSEPATISTRSLPAQFDAVLHFDRTRAVEPLERTAAWQKGEVPETFPSGV